jgi:hypothetical protein
MVIGALSVLFLGGILTMTFLARSASSSVNRSTLVRNDGGRPVILAVDAAVPLNNSLRAQIKRIADDYRRRGYSVLEESETAIASVLPALREWRDSPNAAADESIENFLESQYAYGVLHIEVEKSKKSGRGVVQSPLFVYSTRPGAEERTRIGLDDVPTPPEDCQPFLLINDHPAKADLAVAAEIERRLKAYRQRGWAFVIDDDVEVKVRNVLPLGPIDSSMPLAPALHVALAEADLGGILRIDGKVGPEPVRQRVNVLRIERDPTVPAPPVPDAPDVVEPPSAPVVP